MWKLSNEWNECLRNVPPPKQAGAKKKRLNKCQPSEGRLVRNSRSSSKEKIAFFTITMSSFVQRSMLSACTPHWTNQFLMFHVEGAEGKRNEIINCVNVEKFHKSISPILSKNQKRDDWMTREFPPRERVEEMTQGREQITKTTRKEFH